jgi:transketolase
MVERINTTEFHPSMRGHFAGYLHNSMISNKDIFCLNGDLGYGMYDRIMNDYPNRFINCGAAETAMMGIAAGLAQEGKRPFTYTISSFYMRAAEPIALYIAREQLPVVMIGSGRDNDYEHDGPSHNATLTQEFMRLIGIKIYYPNEKEEMKGLMQEVLTLNEPSFISLRR